MRLPYPDIELAVKTVLLSEETVAQRQVILWAREREPKVGLRARMWWLDWSLI